LGYALAVMELLLMCCFDIPGEEYRPCEITIGKRAAGKKAARR